MAAATPWPHPTVRASIDDDDHDHAHHHHDRDGRRAGFSVKAPGRPHSAAGAQGYRPPGKPRQRTGGHGIDARGRNRAQGTLYGHQFHTDTNFGFARCVNRLHRAAFSHKERRESIGVATQSALRRRCLKFKQSRPETPANPVGGNGGSPLPIRTPDYAVRSDHSFTTSLYSDKGKFHNDLNAARDVNMSECALNQTVYGCLLIIGSQVRALVRLPSHQ
jgi:hypothetical protein